MKYFYYPGCSLEGTAIDYDASTRAVMGALGVELIDVEDWTCCGASAGEVVSPLLSLALAARNLALAESTGIEADMIAPCSACYLNLRKADERMHRDESAASQVNAVLAEERLRYSGGVKVRHLLDVLAKDVSIEKIEARIKHDLGGLRIAPYYGCQALRPYKDFDDPERPVSMEPLIEALGASVHRWDAGARCCGAGLMTTKQPLAIELCGEILLAARGADCIATVCPMCQMNLEYYQKKISKHVGADLKIPIVTLTQLMGLALDVPGKDLMLERNYSLNGPFLKRVEEMAV
jgi:heterodisulfide reductase subunit B2